MQDLKNVRIGAEGYSVRSMYSPKNRKGWPLKTTPSGAEHQINIFSSASEAPSNYTNSRDNNVNPAEGRVNPALETIFLTPTAIFRSLSIGGYPTYLQ